MSSFVEEIYQKLLNSGLSEQELDEQLERKAKEFGGFISKQGILFIIAKEYGINIKSPEIDPMLYEEGENGIDYDEFSIKIADVREGMVSIVLLAKILKLYPSREFIRKDGTMGMVASCIIGDNTGEIKVVMWDEKAIAIKSISFREGEIVRVIADYSKIGKNGKLEVHIGRKGKVILAPKDIDLETVTLLDQVIYSGNGENEHIPSNRFSIKALLKQYSYIKKIYGVLHIEEFKEIIKKDDEKTFLLKIILSDDSGSVRVNIWDMYAVEALKLIEEGKTIILKNVSVKLNSYSNEKELVFTKTSSLQVMDR